MALQRVIAFLLVAAALMVGGTVTAQRPSASPADRERVSGFLSQGRLAELSPPIAEGFEPVFVVDKFEPITDAPAVPGIEVGDQVADGELVLGVALGGEARAYPINMLTGPEREVINDTLGGRPILPLNCAHRESVSTSYMTRLFATPGWSFIRIAKRWSKRPFLMERES